MNARWSSGWGTHPGPVQVGRLRGIKMEEGLCVYELLFLFQIPHGSSGMLFCMDSSSGPSTYNALILFN